MHKEEAYQETSFEQNDAMAVWSDSSVYTVRFHSFCIYLLSDGSRWVTGTNLFVYGGFSVR